MHGSKVVQCSIYVLGRLSNVLFGWYIDGTQNTWWFHEWFYIIQNKTASFFRKACGTYNTESDSKGLMVKN